MWAERGLNQILTSIIASLFDWDQGLYVWNKKNIDKQKRNGEHEYATMGSTNIRKERERQNLIWLDVDGSIAEDDWHIRCEGRMELERRQFVLQTFMPNSVDIPGNVQ